MGCPHLIWVVPPQIQHIKSIEYIYWKLQLLSLLIDEYSQPYLVGKPLFGVGVRVGDIASASQYLPALLLLAEWMCEIL